MVRDVLHGENRLLYTYGVTNSGKTYTIQGNAGTRTTLDMMMGVDGSVLVSVVCVCPCAGSAGEAGLLPRALVSFFTTLAGQLYPRSDLKPVLKQEVRRLGDTEVRSEEDRRHALLREVHAHRGHE